MLHVFIYRKVPVVIINAQLFPELLIKSAHSCIIFFSVVQIAGPDYSVATLSNMILW